MSLLIVDRFLKLTSALLAAAAIFLPAAAAPPPPAQALQAWQATRTLPFTFTYDGKKSSDFLGTWTRTQTGVQTDSGPVYTITYTDPQTSLKVTATVRTFKDFPAIDWVLTFTNDGLQDTPIIEDVKPLAWTMPVSGSPVLHFAQGSNASGDDFMPHDADLGAGKEADMRSAGGRSSNNNMPFFCLQDGAGGLIGAIGWLGNWVAQFNTAADGKSVAMEAHMIKTHFLLHAGETVRTPRIVLLDWKGTDRNAAQNVWRQLVIAHYSPRDPQGHVVTVPICFGQGNDGTAEAEIKTITQLHDLNVPIDGYWIDAEWYGDNDDWVAQRGNWYINTKKYPNGLKEVGDALAADNYGFILWTEAEAAQPHSKFMTDHPDWYLRVDDPNQQGLLNLGNPDARQGMIDFLTDLHKTAGVTWYRQDFNVEPEYFWAKADAPDRVGITEMKDIDGLYQFWDGLRAAHPGLQIDNCASGGRRLDIETISRSVSLFRTDHNCVSFDPLDNQRLTQALNIWLPLNCGTYASVAPGTPNSGSSLVYAIRSSFSSGWLFGTDRLDISMAKPSADEMKEVRPYFTGDFYPLTPYSADPAAWSIQQWDRPDLKAGIVYVFRRQGSATASMNPGLQAIDPAAQYSVETRANFGPGETKTMSGKDLAAMTVTITDKPGSLLVIYKKR